MTDLPPDIAHENAVNDLKKNYTELKELTASIAVRRDELKAQVEEVRAELAQLDNLLDQAVTGDQDNEALTLLGQKHTVEERLASLLAELEQARADTEQTKASLVEVKEGLERLKTERPLAVSRAASVSIDEQLDDFTVDAELIALENAREHIQATIAMVDLNRELSGAAPPEPAIPVEDPEEKARRQLEELKRLRGQGGDPRSNRKL
jgi:phage shock protein A